MLVTSILDRSDFLTCVHANPCLRVLRFILRDFLGLADNMHIITLNRVYLVHTTVALDLDTARFIRMQSFWACPTNSRMAHFLTFVYPTWE